MPHITKDNESEAITSEQTRGPSKDSRGLSSFRAWVDEHSFTRTADGLRRAQSFPSLRVRKLEKETGVLLSAHNPHRAEPRVPVRGPRVQLGLSFLISRLRAGSLSWRSPIPFPEMLLRIQEGRSELDLVLTSDLADLNHRCGTPSSSRGAAPCPLSSLSRAAWPTCPHR